MKTLEIYNSRWELLGLHKEQLTFNKGTTYWQSMIVSKRNFTMELIIQVLVSFTTFLSDYILLHKELYCYKEENLILLTDSSFR